MLRKCGLIVLFSFLFFPAISFAEKQAPWVFFDLGKTLIDHARDYSQMRYLPGAQDYIKKLKRHGYHLGLLINWPENEGRGNAEKLVLLKDFVKPKWTDKVPFDWNLFDAVLFPAKDIYRKPHQYLFIEALRTAAPGPAVYQGEDKEEIQVAKNLGLTAHCVVDSTGKNRVPLLSLEELPTRILESFIYDYPHSEP